MAEDFTVGELAREVQRAVVRMEALAQQLQSGQFVSSEVFRLHKENLDGRIAALKEVVGGKATMEVVVAIQVELAKKASITDLQSLSDEVDSLKDDRKWFVRAVLLIVLTAVLAVAFAYSGGRP